MIKLKTDRLLLVIIAFMMIYNPPIGPIKSLLVVFPIAGFYILLNYRYVKNNFHKIINQYLVWMLLFIYIFVVALCNDNPPAFLQSFIYVLASVIPASIMITCMIDKKGYDLHYYIDTILYAGLIQCVLSIAAFFNRGIKDVLLRLMISGGLFQNDTYSAYMVNLRLFGFSTGLTFGMPSVQAFLAIIALYMAINNKRSVKYYIMIPLFAFSGIINARSSLIIIGIGVIAIALSLSAGNTVKKIARILGIIVLAVVLINVGLSILRTLSPTTHTWIEEGIAQISMFFRGDTTSGYFSYVGDDSRWDLPSGLNLIFGYGIRVLNRNKLNILTDIGYINDIYFGGLIYAVILYTLMIKYVMSLNKYRFSNGSTLNKFLYISFMASFIVLNVKGYVFDLNNFFVLFVMIAIFNSGYASTNRFSIRE